MKTKNIKYFCFGLMMVVVCASAIQKAFHIFSIPHLYGASVYTDKPKFKIEDWISNYYQTNYEKNLEENFGFRNDLVRLNNQINYTAFKISGSNDIEVGKNNYLFQHGYVDAYLGRKKISRNEMQTRLNTLQQFSDSLKTHNTKLIVMLAPGKASYYPEYLPRTDFKKTKNNYELILDLKHDYNFHLVDVQATFLNIKGKTKYPVFAQQGIHWTGYGAFIAMDQLVHEIETKDNIDLCNYQIKEITEAQKPNTDEDLDELLNIIYPLSNYKTYETILSFDSLKFIQKKPSALIVGDSYYWNLANTKIFDNLFSNYDFCYYNQSIYPASRLNPTPIVKKDIIQYAKKFDYIIFVQTEQCYDQIGFGFADNYMAETTDANNYRNDVTFYVNNNKSKFGLDKSTSEEIKKTIVDSLVNYKYTKITDIINSIYDNKDWYNIINQTAINDNIPLQTKIRSDALWVFNKDNDITKK